VPPPCTTCMNAMSLCFLHTRKRAHTCSTCALITIIAFLASSLCHHCHHQLPPPPPPPPTIVKHTPTPTSTTASHSTIAIATRTISFANVTLSLAHSHSCGHVPLCLIAVQCHWYHNVDKHAHSLARSVSGACTNSRSRGHLPLCPIALHCSVQPSDLSRLRSPNPHVQEGAIRGEVFFFFFLFSFTSALTITLCGAAYAFTTVFSTASLLPQPAPHHHAVRYSTPAPSTHTAHSILQSQCSVQHHSFLNQHFTITLPTIAECKRCLWVGLPMHGQLTDIITPQWFH
jgi:hypothetical protein